MSWQDRDDYKQHRSELEKFHKIAAELGMSNPATETLEIVELEMRYSGSDEIPCLGSNVAQLVYMWKTEGNAYYMDKVLLLCRRYGITPPPSVIAEVTAAAEKRYQHGTGALKTTSDRIEHDANKWQALLLMMNLIYNGEKQHRAGSKAAQYMRDVMKVKPIKASTLDKYYVEEIRASGIEAEYFEIWSRNFDDQNHEGWKQIIDVLPEAEKTLKGNRRE